ncbi:MAG: YkgJ family cysteine cluster protein [Deltaproteobacteria bacterium]|nr:YkgJ family cysteine cluster protein [Deltaproteobacteria bacterium]
MTPGDKKRIAQHTGRRDFFTFVVADETYLDQPDDPMWAELVFRPDGSRRVLKRQANGDCTFLGARGCTLALETRPIVCRMYPFDYTESGLREELSHGCPTQLLPRGQGLLAALDMNREDAVGWHAMLYRELAMERDDEDRSDLRPQK